MAPTSRDNQFTRLTIYKLFMPVLNSSYLGLKPDFLIFFQATHHGHQTVIVEFRLDLKVQGVLLCTLTTLRREGCMKDFQLFQSSTKHASF